MWLRSFRLLFLENAPFHIKVKEQFFLFNSIFNCWTPLWTEINLKFLTNGFPQDERLSSKWKKVYCEEKGFRRQGKGTVDSDECLDLLETRQIESLKLELRKDPIIPKFPGEVPKSPL